MASIVSGYKTTLKGFISPIVFDSVTLLDFINTYNKSGIGTPKTMVNIFRSTLNSEFLEVPVNKQPHNIITRIKTLTTEREEQAEEDRDYLVEQIIEKYRDQMSNANWGNGYLVNDKISATPAKFLDNYYYQDIAIIIQERVIVNT